METHGLAAKMIAKMPKIARNCESSAKRARSWKRRIQPRNTYRPSCFPLLGDDALKNGSRARTRKELWTKYQFASHSFKASHFHVCDRLPGLKGQEESVWIAFREYISLNPCVLEHRWPQFTDLAV